MSLYKQAFPGKRCVFLPVVHVEDEAQALRNVQIAQSCGGDGVFLINHRITCDRLQTIYRVVRLAFPTLWIGINFLDLTPNEAAGFAPRDVNGLWVDNCGIDEDAADPLQVAKLVAGIRDTLQSKWVYFGGVAFKHQPQVRSPAEAARVAVPHLDVVTTSGSKTGSAPDVQKIRSMKFAIGSHPLVIASGMTAENVRNFLPYADGFLVATGISDSHTELNPEKVREFADLVILG